jgi:spermidine dehydrogenase
VVSAFRDFAGDAPDEVASIVAAYPLADEDRTALLSLLRGPADPLGDLAPQARVDYLKRTSYSDYLRSALGMPEAVITLIRDMPRGLWGVGWDALSSLEAIRMGMPGIAPVDAALADVSGYGEEPYIFHFPDGNAGIARALVRQLVPTAVPGSTMEDLVPALVDY